MPAQQEQRTSGTTTPAFLKDGSNYFGRMTFGKNGNNRAIFGWSKLLAGSEPSQSPQVQPSRTLTNTQEQRSVGSGSSSQESRSSGSL